MKNYRNIKFSISLIIAVILILSLVSCSGNSNVGNPELPGGYIEKQDFNDTETVSQTEFHIYKYPDSSAFENNVNFEKVGDRSEEVKTYFENFIKWLDVKNRRDEFAFDISSVSDEDYFAVKDSEGEKSSEGYVYNKYENFCLMYFDASENTLYHIVNYY